MTAPARPSHLQPVAVDELMQYPLPATARLDGQSFVKWNSPRWLQSRMFLEASYEVQGVARALFDLCQSATPVGTLPDSDLQLSRMLHLDLAHWIEMRGRALGPLHNWRPCLCGNELRLMHPVVLEVVQDAISRREQHELSKEERAAAARHERMVIALREQGMAPSETDDFMLMQRISDWISAHCKGRRTQSVYRAAMAHAVKSGWCGN